MLIDATQAWSKERLEQAPGARTPTALLWADYDAWMVSKYGQSCGSRRWWAENMKRHGYRIGKGTAGVRVMFDQVLKPAAG